MRLIQIIILLQLMILPVAASEWLPDPLVLVKHRQLLALRDQQVEQLLALTNEGLQALAPLRQQARQAQLELDAKLQEQPFDHPGSRAAGLALLDAERAVKSQMLDILLRAQAILNQQQRDRMLQRLRQVIVTTDDGEAEAPAFDMQQALARIKHLAQQYQAQGGDISDLQQHLQLITDAAQRGEDHAVEIMVRTAIQELEQRLEDASTH